MKKARIKQYETTLVKSVLEKKVNVTTWLLTTLIVSGRIASELFLSKPTYYPKDPWEVIGEGQELTKQLIEKAYLKKGIKKLQKYGIVQESNGLIKLTLKGKSLANRIMGFKKILDTRWDGKYRMVIFDIPEKQRHHRDWLRTELYYLEYIQLQKSVFISKYPLTPEIIKEIKRREVDEGVNYILAEKIYDLQKMRRNSKFGLLKIPKPMIQ
jgi:hypothetical protein